LKSGLKNKRFIMKEPLGQQGAFISGIEAIIVFNFCRN